MAGIFSLVKSRIARRQAESQDAPSPHQTGSEQLLAELRQTIVARDTLAKERDELRAHTIRLDAERDEAHAQLQKLQADCQNMLAPPGHFYSPVVDPASPAVQAIIGAEDRRFQQSCPGVRMDEEAQLRLLERFARDYYPDLPFTPEKSPGLRYYYENPAFSYGDAIALFCMIRDVKPRRFVEVGCGFSSSVTLDTNDLFFGGKIEVTMIDPYPQVLLDRLEPADPYRSRIVAKPLQDAPDSLFTQLEENDILFIDSSHVSKMGSDVNDYLFRIFPLLNPGVVIHIHDIFYPFEYPGRWVTETNHSWNETYALHAFLQYNDCFEIVFFSDLVYLKYQQRTRELMPLCLNNSGGGIWLRKIR